MPFWIWTTLGFNFLVSISLFLVAYYVNDYYKRRSTPEHEKSEVTEQPSSQRTERSERIVTEKVDRDVTGLKKLEALRNAVLNPAFSPLVEEDLQHIFLNFVDKLTPWHIRVLKFLDNPEEWLRQSAIPIPEKALGTPSSVLFTAFPELGSNKDLAEQLIRDLSERGLSADWDNLNKILTRRGMLSPRTTSLGKQFLEFITSPIEKLK